MTVSVKAGEFCWNELMTNDVASCKEFYGSLFGWEVHEHDVGDATYTLFKKGDKDVGGMMQIPPHLAERMPSHWMSYVLVDDLDKIIAKAKSLGAIIIKEPMPVGDFGRLAVLQDPSGAHIALWESLKSC